MQTEKEIKDSLANIPFESLLKANKITGVDSHSKKISKIKTPILKSQKNKVDKNAPKEQSSKVPVNPFKVVMPSINFF